MSSRRHDIRTQNTRNTQRLFFVCDLCVDRRPRGRVAAACDAQASKTRAHVEALASPRLEGRLAGSNGERLASDYIVAELQKIGAKPLPGQQDFRLPFEFTAGTTRRRLDRSQRRRTASIRTQADVQALSFSDNGDVDGAGRLRRLRHRRARRPGFRLRQLRDARREGQDRPRAALLPRGRRAEDARHPRALRRPALQGDGRAAARRQGDDRRHRPALAERRRAGADDVRHGARRLRHRRRQHQRRRSRRRCSRRAGQDARGRRRSRSTTRNPHVTGFALPGVTRRASTPRSSARSGPATTSSPTCRRRRRSTASPSRGSRSARTTIISATAKPATRSPARTTRARSTSAPTTTRRAPPRCSAIGAALAQAAAPPQRRRSASGRARSSACSARPRLRRKPPVPLDQLAAYLNFDMVGRMQDNKLTVQATGTSPAWATHHRAGERRRRLRPAVQEDPYQPTDVATFNQASVPCLSFFTGTHADYHRPSDTADKIDYEDLDRVVDFAAAIVRRLERRARGAGVHEGRPADADRRRPRRRARSSPARFPTTPPR